MFVKQEADVAGTETVKLDKIERTLAFLVIDLGHHCSFEEGNDKV